MQKRVGEKLTVMVTGFAPRKVFFETDEHIECSWDVTTSPNYYVFDEENYCMVDRESDTVFNLGDKVEAVLERAEDVYKRQQLKSIPMKYSIKKFISKGQTQVYI